MAQNMGSYQIPLKKYRGYSMKKVNFMILFVLLNAFFFINVDTIFPDNPTHYRNIITIYIILTTFFFSALDGEEKLLNINPLDAFLKFLVTFFAGATLAGSLHTVIPSATVQGLAFKSVVLLYTFVVSINEDIIFQGMIPQYLGEIPSALIFSIFHYTAYVGATLSTFVVAFCASLILQWIIRHPKLGIPVSSPLHAVYNLFQVGAI